MRTEAAAVVVADRDKSDGTLGMGMVWVGMEWTMADLSIAVFPRRVLRVLLAVFACGSFGLVPLSSVRAVPPEFDVFREEWRTVPIPSSAGSLLGRVVSGDFDGDGRTDLVVLAGSDPLVLFAPAVYEASMLLDETGETRATDLAVVPGNGVDPTRLVTGGVDGVSLWCLPAGESRFQETVLSPGSCRALTVVDFDGLGESRVAWVNGDGTEILSVDLEGGEAQVFPFTPTSEIVSILTVRWIEGVEDQLAVFEDHVLSILDSGGQGLASFPMQQAVDLACWRLPGEETDRLGWIDELSLTPGVWNQSLHLATPSEGLVETIAVGASGFKGFVGAELDGDGNPDLLVSRGEEGGVIVLWGREEPPAGSPEPRYDLEDSRILGGGLSGPGPNGEPIFNGRPLAVDLDGDTRLDVLASGSEGSGHLLVAMNQLEPRLFPYAPDVCVTTVSAPGDFSLQLDFPRPPSVFDELELVVFRVPLFQTVPATEPWFELPWASYQEFGGSVTVPLDADPSASIDRYFILTRKRSPSGVTSPDRLHLFVPGSGGECGPPFSGRKVEGLNVRCFIIFGEVEEPPGGERP